MKYSYSEEARKRHGQLVCDSETGDCFRASMSYLFGVPNSEDLPNDHTLAYLGWAEFLHPFGLSIEWQPKSCWKSGLWIASVPSKNFKNRSHAIVMKHDKVEFDPSPFRRYHRGYSLLGTNLVSGGYCIIATDPARLGVLQ